MASCPTCGRAMLSEWPHDHRTADPDAALREAAQRLIDWYDGRNVRDESIEAEVAALRSALAATASPGLDVERRYEPLTLRGDAALRVLKCVKCGELHTVDIFALAADRETPEGWTLKDVRE